MVIHQLVFNVGDREVSAGKVRNTRDFESILNRLRNREAPASQAPPCAFGHRQKLGPGFNQRRNLAKDLGLLCSISWGDDLR
jgi:hypothetical protein